MCVSEDLTNGNNNSIHNALKILSTEGLEGAMMVVEWELDKEPKSWEAWGAKADILYLNAKYSECLKCCERSIAFNPENALTWNTKGNALYMLKKYDEAIDCYSKAIEIEPLLARAWHNKKLALEFQLRRSAPRISM